MKIFFVFIHELILNPSRVQEAEAILQAASLLGMDSTNCEIVVI